MTEGRHQLSWGEVVSQESFQEESHQDIQTRDEGQSKGQKVGWVKDSRGDETYKLINKRRKGGTKISQTFARKRVSVNRRKL